MPTKLLLLLLTFTTVSNVAQTNSENYFSAESRLKFGNQLYRTQDYLRALEEFKETLKLNDNDTIRFRYANCFLRIGRYVEASQNFKTLFVSSDLREEAKLLFHESNFLQKDFQSFRSLYESKIYFSHKYSRNLEQLNSISYFLDNSTLPNENQLLQPFDDSVQSKLAHFYQMKKFPQLKSPLTAALLSAVVPGAGKIYSGELTDGLIALGATALSVFLAINNFQNDHQFRGWVFTGLSAFFYGGSVYGSAAAAQIYNAKFQMTLDSEINIYFESKNYFLPKIDF